MGRRRSVGKAKQAGGFIKKTRSQLVIKMNFKVLVMTLLVSMALAIPTKDGEKTADAEKIYLDVPFELEVAPEQDAPVEMKFEDVPQAPEEEALEADEGEGYGEGGSKYGYGWRLQASNVCFRAKDRGPGVFKLKDGGALVEIRLVHKSGFVNCASNGAYRSNFGCSIPHNGDANPNRISTYITDEFNRIVFPKNPVKPSKAFYTLPGYHASSKELALSDYCTPMVASVNQEMKIWYGEDLAKHYAGDNSGKSCVDVYAKFI